jgi:hypothetical protein
MNDEFLKQFYEAPRTKFADALYEQISQQPQPRFAETMVKKLTFRNSIIMFALLFLITVPVYAAIESRWHQIGEIWVDVQSAQKPPTVIQSSLYKGIAGDMEVANLVEAKTTLKFEFAFPSWAPDRFVLDDQMNISPWSQKTLSAFWKNQDGGDPIGIFLKSRWYWMPVTKNPILESVSTWPVVPGSFEEVEVQGRPAVLVRGDWNWHMQVVEEETTEMETEMELEWDEQNGISLYWTDGEVSYLLWTHNPAVSAEDLVKMAESMR